MTSALSSVSHQIGQMLARFRSLIVRAWAWHCAMFEADPRYRLLVVALADLLARRIDPAQLLRWLQRQLVQHLLATDADY